MQVNELMKDDYDKEKQWIVKLLEKAVVENLCLAFWSAISNKDQISSRQESKITTIGR